jgi:regulator of protease activity HflC (stomatin/prohibitin superfamily)
MITCIKTIQPGYAGLVYNMNGGLQNTTLSQGVHFVPPTQQVTSYPISTESVYFSKSGSEGNKSDESINPITADGKTISMDVSYTYHYNLADLTKVFAKFRGQSADTISNGYIRQFMKDSINAVTSQYGLFDIYGSKQSEVASKIFVEFQKRMAPDGIAIESFSIMAVRPDADTMKGIQAKVDAQQAYETAKVKLQQAEVDAKTAVTKAQGEADANRVLEASIDQNLINYDEIQKWDGKMPTTMAGAGGLSVILGDTGSSNSTTTQTTTPPASSSSSAAKK